MELIKHLEQYLGSIQQGIFLDDRKYHLSMSMFFNTPFEDVYSYASLGVSDFLLDSNTRVEFIFGAEKGFEKSKIAQFFLTFCERIIENGEAPKKGNVYDFGDYIYPQSKMRKLYITTPIFFPSDFQVLNYNNIRVIFPWVIPIHENESEYILEEGYEKFELYLADNEISDFWDLFREPFFNFYV